MFTFDIQLFGGRGANFTLKRDRIARNIDNTKIIIPKGTKFTNVRAIAGKGRKREIDTIKNVVERNKGNAKNWSKMVANATIKGKKAHVHYYQNKKDNIGRVEFKIKRWL